MLQVWLDDAEHTAAFGALLWQLLPIKQLVFLRGDLGAGKTTLVRGLLRAAGYTGAVKSPTYSLVEEYQLNDRRLFHFDLYRLRDPEELVWLGIDDYLNQTALCFIEWPQQGDPFLPAPDVALDLAYQQQQRVLLLQANDLALEKKIELHWKNKEILL